VRAFFAILAEFNIEGQQLSDRRSAGAWGKCLDMDEDILATLRRLDEPEASLIIPCFEVPA
jgi:hypothetical protein